MAKKTSHYTHTAVTRLPGVSYGFLVDEDMRENLFIHFRSRWPWPLTSISSICMAIF